MKNINKLSLLFLMILSGCSNDLTPSNFEPTGHRINNSELSDYLEDYNQKLQNEELQKKDIWYDFGVKITKEYIYNNTTTKITTYMTGSFLDSTFDFYDKLQYEAKETIYENNQNINIGLREETNTYNVVIVEGVKYTKLFSSKIENGLSSNITTYTQTSNSVYAEISNYYLHNYDLSIFSNLVNEDNRYYFYQNDDSLEYAYYYKVENDNFEDYYFKNEGVKKCYIKTFGDSYQTKEYKFYYSGTLLNNSIFYDDSREEHYTISVHMKAKTFGFINKPIDSYNYNYNYQ